MLENLYTTKMSGNTKMLQKRFTKIRSHQSRKSKIAAVAVSATLLAAVLFATVAMAAMDNTDSIKYEVYNGSERVYLNHTPFIYDGEYYLPLRDTLNGFGVTDITYNDGEAVINFPEATEGAAKQVKLKIGTALLYITQPDIGGIVTITAPVLVEGTMYAPVYVFELLMSEGQIPDFGLNVIRPTEPSYYYLKGESVFIGTAQEQDEYTANHNNEIVKRIIVDEQGRTIAVIPTENQGSENVEQRLKRVAGWRSYESYNHLLYSGVGYSYNSKGESYMLSEFSVIELGDKSIAYILPTDIITIPDNEFNKDIRRTVNNTYGR